MKERKKPGYKTSVTHHCSQTVKYQNSYELVSIEISYVNYINFMLAAHFSAQKIQAMKDEYALQYQNYNGFTKAILNWYSIKQLTFRL
ncbi:hypothetical protein NGH30_03085 [Macrococcus caseolyticus]|uniref:hypothetical protein n=1 Tax=Macrococcoides caseolyticum TaxID=69966 RepID=UPI002DBE79AB|nr:hypothetical protein [Macrococcus caseolyticus]MEB8170818.1 hypothetical protein [Macrococcus caseolyticus]